MKRIVRLTESDLARIVRRVIREGVTDVPFSLCKVKGTGVGSIFAPNETKIINGSFLNFSTESNAKILSATVVVTPEGTKAGLTAANLTVTTPVSASKAVATSPNKDMYNLNGKLTYMSYKATSYVCTFKAPNKKWINSTGKGVALFEITFSTNDQYTPTQTVSFAAQPNTQFGVAAAAGN